MISMTYDFIIDEDISENISEKVQGEVTDMIPTLNEAITVGTRLYNDLGKLILTVFLPFYC